MDVGQLDGYPPFVLDGPTGLMAGSFGLWMWLYTHIRLVQSEHDMFFSFLLLFYLLHIRT